MHATDNTRFFVSEIVMTHGSPDTVVKYLETSFSWIWPINQSYCNKKKKNENFSAAYNEFTIRLHRLQAVCSRRKLFSIH